MLEHDEQIGQIAHRIARHKESAGRGFGGNSEGAHWTIKPLAAGLNCPRVAIGHVEATIGSYLIKALIFAGEFYKRVISIECHKSSIA
jgi:hypothetical protein